MIARGGASLYWTVRDKGHGQQAEIGGSQALARGLRLPSSLARFYQPCLLSFSLLQILIVLISKDVFRDRWETGYFPSYSYSTPHHGDGHPDSDAVPTEDIRPTRRVLR